MAAATARPTVKRFPELEAATTIEASTSAITAANSVIGSLTASVAARPTATTMTYNPGHDGQGTWAPASHGGQLRFFGETAGHLLVVDMWGTQRRPVLLSLPSASTTSGWNWAPELRLSSDGVLLRKGHPIGAGGGHCVESVGGGGDACLYPGG